MEKINEIISVALREVDSLRNFLKRRKLNQIRNNDEKQMLKKISLCWFDEYRKEFLKLDEADLNNLDQQYHSLSSSSDKGSSRKLVLKNLKTLRDSLSALRKIAIVNSIESTKFVESSAPDFSALVLDLTMQKLLTRRWNECGQCIRHKIPMAAIVMIGGFIEALIIAKIDQEKDKAKIYTSKSAPRDGKSSQVKTLSQWTLSDLLQLSYELKWLSKPVKDIGGIFREYRNYIHPHKEFVENLTLEIADAELYWEIAKGITVQLLKK